MLLVFYDVKRFGYKLTGIVISYYAAGRNWTYGHQVFSLVLYH